VDLESASWFLIYLLQAGLQGRRDQREGMAARVNLFRRVPHSGDVDQRLSLDSFRSFGPYSRAWY